MQHVFGFISSVNKVKTIWIKKHRERRSYELCINVQTERKRNAIHRQSLQFLQPVYSRTGFPSAQASLSRQRLVSSPEWSLQWCNRVRFVCQRKFVECEEQTGQDDFFSTSVALNFLRDAVLCMLRRNFGINQPALLKYLMTFFLWDSIRVACAINCDDFHCRLKSDSYLCWGSVWFGWRKIVDSKEVFIEVYARFECSWIRTCGWVSKEWRVRHYFS